MNIQFDSEKHKTDKEYRSSIINGLGEKKREYKGKSVIQLYKSLSESEREISRDLDL
jgi:hypothetical protein